MRIDNNVYTYLRVFQQLPFGAFNALSLQNTVETWVSQSFQFYFHDTKRKVINNFLMEFGHVTSSVLLIKSIYA